MIESAGVVALTLEHDELVPNARLVAPVNGLPPSSIESALLVAFAKRTFAFTVAASVTLALMTGLKSKPFFSMELPRCTKLLLTSKSMISVVVEPPTIWTGLSRLTLMPLLLAIGNVTLGEVLPVSVRPFLSVTPDLLGSMMKRNPL